ncbi:MAG: DNA polymerase ligase N-terminal domain-containing protein [Pseudolabrys sp.]
MAALTSYNAKRRFGVTKEPRGKVGKAGHAFVVQKHAARQLHYDLRLQLDGVMKSWAVTRGPSLVPGEKRLAVQVEDHPIDYNKFEGTIPEGEYGAGTKLHGGWHLVRMRRRRGEKRDNWLLIKQRDEDARAKGDKDILEEQPLSVKTGRDMGEIAQRRRKAKSKSKAKGKKSKHKTAKPKRKKTKKAKKAKRKAKRSKRR